MCLTSKIELTVDMLDYLFLRFVTRGIYLSGKSLSAAVRPEYDYDALELRVPRRAYQVILHVYECLA